MRLSVLDQSPIISGHTPAPTAGSGSVTETPEHDWAAASAIIYPSLRPIGTQGLTVSEIDAESLISHPIKLEEVNDAFGAMERGEVIRSVITSF